MILTNITNQYCSALTIIDGVYHRKSYMNSAEGRIEFAAECAGADNYPAVMEVWGDTPTVDEPTFPDMPVGTTPTVQAQLDAQADAIAELAAIIAGGE